VENAFAPQTLARHCNPLHQKYYFIPCCRANPEHSALARYLVTAPFKKWREKNSIMFVLSNKIEVLNFSAEVDDVDY
jgi:hypothetical protein